MDRALKIPEIVSMIVENLSDNPDVRGMPRRIDIRTPFSADLARIARIGQIWWEPAVRGLYHDVKEYHISYLIKIIDEEWAGKRLVDFPHNEITQKRFYRFLRYTRHVRMMMIALIDDVHEKANDPTEDCYASAFRKLGRLRDLYVSGHPVFPNLRSLSLSIRNHVALRSAVVLLQPRLQWVNCVFMVGAIPHVPNFLVAVAEHAPNVTTISLQRAIPHEDYPALATTLRSFRKLTKFNLFCPTSSYLVLKALSDAHRLEELSLTFKSDLEIIHHTLHFPNVWRVVLRGSPEGLLRFLDGAELPRVWHVWVTAENESLGCWEEVLQALEQKFPKVKYFGMDVGRLPGTDEQPPGFDKPTVDLLPLGAFPNLKELFLKEGRLRVASLPEKRFGIDAPTLARIQASWPRLETLGMKNECWIWENVALPAALSFDCIVEAIVNPKLALEWVRVVVELGTLPSLSPAPDTKAATHAYLRLSRVSDKGADTCNPQRKVSISASLEWQERCENQLVSKTFPFDFDYNIDTGSVTLLL